MMELMQLLDMLVHVDKTLGTLLQQYGIYVYAVLFAIVFCETGLVVMFFRATPCCSSPAPSAPPGR
jgi:membrane-associated protein